MESLDHGKPGIKPFSDSSVSTNLIMCSRRIFCTRWTVQGARESNKIIFFLIEDAVAPGTLVAKLVRQATKWNDHEAYVLLRNGYVFSGPQTATILMAKLRLLFAYGLWSSSRTLSSFRDPRRFSLLTLKRLGISFLLSDMRRAYKEFTCNCSQGDNLV